MAEHGRIEVEDKVYEGEVLTGTDGDRALSITNLYSKTDLTTYDPGFTSTSACRSEITYLDGERGILRYRGYPIEQLAEHSTFTEVAYLLIYGELPTRAELTEFEHQITIHTLLHEDMRRFFDAFPKNAHPMAILAAATAALSTFYQDHYEPTDDWDVEVSTYRLMAKLPTVAAFAYKKSIGQAYIYPRNNLTYAQNFLHMMFAVMAEPYEVDRDVAKALDVLYILHADHEQNASTSTVRLVGLDAREHVRRDRRGHHRAVGAAPRRREPGGPRDARGDPQRRRRREEGRRARQGQERPVPADGLRAPRLQELRPARGDHQEAGRQGPRPSWATTRCWTSRCSWSRSRSRTTTSSSASSTPTSTSTPG